MSQKKAECLEHSGCINRQITHLLKTLTFMGKKKQNGSCCKRNHDLAWFYTTEEKIEL